MFYSNALFRFFFDVFFLCRFKLHEASKKKTVQGAGFFDFVLLLFGFRVLRVLLSSLQKTTVFSLYPLVGKLIIPLFLTCCMVFPATAFGTTKKEVTNFAYKGVASWYGTTAQGNPTASGDIYQVTRFSAAHRSLPFGTVVRVHNSANGQQVLVRVNDRGPFLAGRILDVSKRAAGNLRMLSSGLASVSFEQVTDTSGRPLSKGNGFFVRLAETGSVQSAHKLSGELEERLKQEIRVIKAEAPFKRYALCVGPFKTFKKAEKAMLAIENTHTVKDIVEAPVEGTHLPYKRAPRVNQKGGSK